MKHIFMYTDGSCNTVSHIGAWASIVLRGAEKVVLQGQAFNTTHQRMELVAVIEALDHLVRHKLTSEPVTLVTDSQYVAGLPRRKEKLQNSNFITKGNKTLSNADLLITLFNYFEKFRLTLIKVKSHQNDSVHEKLNGEVDKLCRKMVRDLS